MVKSFQDLTESQKADYRSKCQKFGVGENEHAAAFRAANGPVVISGRLEESSIPVKIVTIANVQALKNLVGFKDEDYESNRFSDAFVRYPRETTLAALAAARPHLGDSCKLEATLDGAAQGEIAKALHAFVMGNSNKVKDYEDYINALHFPMQAAVASAPDITITAQNPLVINNPSGPTQLIFGSMLIERGGYIEARTPAQIDAQVVTKQ